MARPSAGFAPAGHIEGQDPARLDQLSDAGREPAAKARQLSEGRDRTADGLGVLVRRIVTYMYRWGLSRSRRRRTEHARDLRLGEQREEDRDALHDRGADLRGEREPVVPVPALDRLHLLPQVTPRAALPFLGLERDLELGEPVPEHRIEPAHHPLLPRGVSPDPVLQRFRTGDQVLAGDHGVCRASRVRQVLGLADLLGEEPRVDRAAVDIPQSDPAPRQEPVQFDDPAHEVRIGFLPERLSALAEELVDQGGDGVGERVGIEQRIVERVPQPGTVEPDLEVIVPAPGLLEDAAHRWQKQGSVFASPDGITTCLHAAGCVYHMVCPKVVSRFTRRVYGRNWRNGEIWRLGRSTLPHPRLLLPRHVDRRFYGMSITDSTRCRSPWSERVAELDDLT